MKILTIDFDIIMEPSINLYNGLISDDFSYSDKFADFYFMTLPPANLDIYRQLSQFLLSYKSCPKLFIENHDEVYKFIKDNDLTNVELINIDHHHDISYDDDSFISAQELTCGNWVGKCIVEHLIDKYIWIRNENSVMPTYIVCNQLENKYRQTAITDDEYLSQSLVDIDYIIICKSAPWVPNQYMPLLDLWKKF